MEPSKLGLRGDCFSGRVASVGFEQLTLARVDALAARTEPRPQQLAQLLLQCSIARCCAAIVAPDSDSVAARSASAARAFSSSCFSRGRSSGMTAAEPGEFTSVLID